MVSFDSLCLIRFYGNTVSTNLVIAIISIVVNVVTIPIGMYLINLGQAKDRAKLSVQAENAVNAKANAKGDITLDPARDAATDKTAELMVHGTSNTGKNRNGNLQALLDALKQPICWASLLAIFLVLVGIHVLVCSGADLDLIAKANSGVAVLSAGLALSTVKILARLGNHLEHVLPPDSDACSVSGVALLCGMGGDMNKISMLVMAVALPPAFSGIIISSRYNIYVKEGASTTALSPRWHSRPPVCCGSGSSRAACLASIASTWATSRSPSCATTCSTSSRPTRAWP